jgi:hypothetical protein
MEQWSSPSAAQGRPARHNGLRLIEQLQRDFRDAKDMEALPGFTWDRSVHRLTAPPNAWEAAEKVELPSPSNLTCSLTLRHSSCCRGLPVIPANHAPSTWIHTNTKRSTSHATTSSPCYAPTRPRAIAFGQVRVPGLARQLPTRLCRRVAACCPLLSLGQAAQRLPCPRRRRRGKGGRR